LYFSKIQKFGSTITHNHFINTYYKFTDSITLQAEIMPTAKKFFVDLETMLERNV